MEALKVFLEQNFDLKNPKWISKIDWDLIASIVVRKEVSKKTLLISKGQIENKLYFIEKGIARFFMPNEDKDLTFNIVFENGFLSAYDSFLTQTAATYNIETLTDAILWEFNYDDLQKIYAETTIGNLIGRQASEELFLKKQKRELSLLNFTAKQRYLSLFTEQA